MFNFLITMVNLGGKILSFAFVIAVFKALVGNGKDTIDDLMQTIVMGIKVGAAKIQMWLFRKYKEMGKGTDEEKKET